MVGKTEIQAVGFQAFVEDTAGDRTGQKFAQQMKEDKVQGADSSGG